MNIVIIVLSACAFHEINKFTFKLEYMLEGTYSLKIGVCFGIVKVWLIVPKEEALSPELQYVT